MDTRKTIGTQKSDYLLHCNYKYLDELVSSATLESPLVASLLLERDFIYLMKPVNPAGDSCHLKASVRMACAFFGVGDPFPDFVGGLKSYENTIYVGGNQK